MLKLGKYAQVTQEMQRYGVSILGMSEMRWNSCGKMMTASGETVLYSEFDTEDGENRERGDKRTSVGFDWPHAKGPDGHVAKRALEWNPQGKYKRGRPRHT